MVADDRAKRAGCKADDNNIAYKVRGGFGADKDDELIPDTRWIKLSELVYNSRIGLNTPNEHSQVHTT